MKPALLLALFTVATGILSAAERVALVMGNNTYDKAKAANERPNLQNATQDAEAVRGMLVGKLGFAAEDVLFGKDLGKVDTLELLEKFRVKATGAKVAVIYYAGHGMESLDGTTNFIVPVDAVPSAVAASDARLRGGGVDVGAELQLLGRMAPGAAKVVLLDCCRERPSGRNLGAVRGGGLTPVAEDAIPAGTLIMLAAAPGRTASDGKKHGPFTEALLETLPVAERTMMESFYALSDRVEELTKGQQIPWMKSDGSAKAFRETILLRRAGGGTASPSPAPSAPDHYALFAGKVAGERKLVEVAPGVSVPFRWCPPGTFTMGSPKAEEEIMKKWGLNDSDDPEHRVTLTKGFWLAETEVTQGQWLAVMKTGLKEQAAKALQDDTLYDLPGKKQTTYRDWWGRKKTDDPAAVIGEESERVAMYYVNHGEAEDWCAAASRHAGVRDWTVSLPSEAQWEYACRAGTQGMTHAGDFEIRGEYNAPGLDGIAWYGGNSSQGYSGPGWNTEKWAEKQYSGGMAGPRRVGSKQANPWGLHDMIGNLWEWCGDWGGGEYPEGEVTDPLGASSGVKRIGRGGSWHAPAVFCLAALRYSSEPSSRHFYLGFRPALVPSR